MKMLWSFIMGTIAGIALVRICLVLVGKIGMNSVYFNNGQVHWLYAKDGSFISRMYTDYEYQNMKEKLETAWPPILAHNGSIYESDPLTFLEWAHGLED